MQKITRLFALAAGGALLVANASAQNAIPADLHGIWRGAAVGQGLGGSWKMSLEVSAAGMRGESGGVISCQFLVTPANQKQGRTYGVIPTSQNCDPQSTVSFGTAQGNTVDIRIVGGGQNFAAKLERLIAPIAGWSAPPTPLPNILGVSLLPRADIEKFYAASLSNDLPQRSQKVMTGPGWRAPIHYYSRDITGLYHGPSLNDAAGDALTVFYNAKGLQEQLADTDKAVIVARVWVPKRNEAPNYQTVLNSLTEKYGPPSLQSPLTTAGQDAGDQVFEWLYDASGKKLTGEAAKACDLRQNKPNMVFNQTIQVNTGSSYHAFKQGVFLPMHPGCGVALRGVVDSERDGVLNNLRLILYDQKALLAEEWAQKQLTLQYQIGLQVEKLDNAAKQRPRL